MQTITDKVVPLPDNEMLEFYIGLQTQLSLEVRNSFLLIAGLLSMSPPSLVLDGWEILMARPFRVPLAMLVSQFIVGRLVQGLWVHGYQTFRFPGPHIMNRNCLGPHINRLLQKYCLLGTPAFVPSHSARINAGMPLSVDHKKNHKANSSKSFPMCSPSPNLTAFMNTAFTITNKYSWPLLQIIFFLLVSLMLLRQLSVCF